MAPTKYHIIHIFKNSRENNADISFSVIYKRIMTLFKMTLLYVCHYVLLYKNLCHLLSANQIPGIVVCQYGYMTCDDGSSDKSLNLKILF